jgi:hypothetical protein
MANEFVVAGEDGRLRGGGNGISVRLGVRTERVRITTSANG